MSTAKMSTAKLTPTKDIDLTPTGWAPARELTAAEWRAEGDALGASGAPRRSRQPLA